VGEEGKNMSIEAMKQALEALESYYGYMEPLLTVFGGPRVPAEQSTTSKVEKAITSIRQAIAEAEKQVSYTGNGTAGREDMTAPTGFLFQMPKAEKQEPVAWSYWQSCLNDDGTQTAPWVHRLSKFKPHESIINKDVVPLYTHPPQRTWQGLTDAEITEIRLKSFDSVATNHAVYQAIESKLREKNT
jgi:hypothetical protein